VWVESSSRKVIDIACLEVQVKANLLAGSRNLFEFHCFICFVFPIDMLAPRLAWVTSNGDPTWGRDHKA
jgi:hypothetical protein